MKEVFKLAAEQAIVDQKMIELKVKVDEQVLNIFIIIFINNFVLFASVFRFGRRIKKSTNSRNSSRKPSKFYPLRFSRPAKNWRASPRPISIRFHPKSSLNTLTSMRYIQIILLLIHSTHESLIARISESNAICAPLAWQLGDLRRPYPTDIEMRLGFLGKSDLSLNGGALQQQSSLNDLHRNSSGGLWVSIIKIK